MVSEADKPTSVVIASTPVGTARRAATPRP